MWKGKMTEELTSLFIAYAEENFGAEPDEYDEICYDAMTCEEFAAYIRLALKKHQELPDVVE